MLTLSEIQQININQDIAREALRQAEMRLEDLSDAARNLEKRAFTLLAGYSALIVFFLDQAQKMQALAPSSDGYQYYLIAAGMLTVANLFLMFALMSLLYGVKGAHPISWLQPGYLDGSDATLAKMLAFEAHSYGKRISDSRKSNAFKCLMLDLGIGIGVGSLVLFTGLVAFA